MLNKEEVFNKIKEIISKSIDIDESDIKLSSKLFVEFQIESVEILELTFRIEKAFNFTMGEGEFWNVATLIANGDLSDGVFTMENIELIKTYFDIDEATITQLSSPFDLYDYIKIEDLVNYIMKKVQ